MKRHNGLSNYLKRGCEQRGNTVNAEPLFEGPNGALKPDLVVYDRDQIAVIDVQVINDQFPLKVGHGNKVSKYSVLREVERATVTRARFHIIDYELARCCVWSVSGRFAWIGTDFTERPEGALGEMLGAWD
ncbi:hypothetical protein JTE90_013403 [Oedothorax gibbosus]|uniref:Reverse transcriptase n=1 Tax=Oedothorax gibbosus TaxID=931172 RepID=A0AAV6TVS1_9ARAC|nr:hypothetical protein JTE90_013403 [Oedothorax gibbosus]